MLPAKTGDPKVHLTVSAWRECRLVRDMGSQDSAHNVRGSLLVAFS
jgi:hypothetical protein